LCGVRVRTPNVIKGWSDWSKNWGEQITTRQ